MTAASSPSGGTRHILLLQRLASTPEQIAQFADGLPDDIVARIPDDERWNASMITAHLFNAERLFQARLENILEELNPLLPRFGPEEATPHSDRQFDVLLDDFRASRQATLALLYSLKPEDWNRAARHETQGPTTMFKQVQTLMNHDTSHLGQLYDLRQLWKAQAGNLPDAVANEATNG